jgi:hypothetical protein
MKAYGTGISPIMEPSTSMKRPRRCASCVLNIACLVEDVGLNE